MFVCCDLCLLLLCVFDHGFACASVLSFVLLFLSGVLLCFVVLFLGMFVHGLVCLSVLYFVIVVI